MFKQIYKFKNFLKEIPTKHTHACASGQIITSFNCPYSLSAEEKNSQRLKPIESRRFVAPKLNYSTAAKKTLNVAKKKMAKLNEQERSELLQPLLDAGWSMVAERDAIYREYCFSDFNQAFRFITGVAMLAEKMNHHPEWFNVYNKLQVTMTTHDAGGISGKDIRMAKYMDEEFKRYI